MTIGDDNKAKHIPPFIWKMCEHFIMGPDYVPRTALDDGKNFIYECIKILIADARYSFNKWGRVEGAIDEIIRTSENFFLLGGLYKDDQIIKRVLKIYREAIDESVSEGTTQYRHGLKKIKSSLVRLENIRFKYNIESREIRETMATLNIMCSKSLA
jgi:hypothetical protein